MTQEGKFLQALKDVFVGATIEGASGYINLMRIKARYFEQGVFPPLMRDIDAAVAPFPGFREELFDKLYDFFHRYFSESGSIYFRYTPLHQRVYEKVYSDERDVALFYKTHMLYYVKTDRLFQSMDAVVDGLPFHFDVTGLEHKRANEKRALVFEFRERRADNVLVLAVGYSENGRKSKIDEIVRAVQRTGVRVDEETLERAFRLFERQSEVDFFINKDARAFLREQFDLWLYQYVFEPEQRSQTLWSEWRIRQVQVLKDTAYKIIDFIAQFEDELVRIWNKPKFVRGSHYIITLERMAAQGEAGQALLGRFFTHRGMTAQVQEWRNLGMLDAEQARRIAENPSGLAPLDERTRFLPLDTRHFPDLEGELTALFDHLDDALDGWLVKSENYQALISLLPKHRGSMKAVYIDPPYNTATSEILYINDYKESSWLTLMENRLAGTTPFLDHDGFLCITIDDFEIHKLKNLVEQVPGLEIVGTAAIKNSPSGRPTVRGFRINHEYAVFAARNKRVEIGTLDRSKEQMALYRETDEKGAFQWANLRKRGGANTLRAARPKQFYPIYVLSDRIRIPRLKWDKEKGDWTILDQPENEETVVYPIGDDGKERIWALGHDTARKQLSDLQVRRRNGSVYVFRKLYLTATGSLPSTWWDKPKYFTVENGTGLLERVLGTYQAFPFPKSVYAVEDCLRVAGVYGKARVLDFFAGSGTTAHAVMNLNREDGGQRKYILVEMGEHFETVILPRVKKVAFSDQWRDGQAQPGGRGISHFVKYFTLEQYEDVLRRAVYADTEPLFVQADPFNQYVFLRDLKLLDNAETGAAVMTLDFEQDAVHVHLEQLYPDVDVAETLSCVTGQRIRRLTGDEVEFENGERMSLSDPPWEAVKPLIWW
jgi:adenine-specific DNA-methyltransferase